MYNKKEEDEKALARIYCRTCGQLVIMTNPVNGLKPEHKYYVRKCVTCDSSSPELAVEEEISGEMLPTRVDFSNAFGRSNEQTRTGPGGD